MRQVIGYSETTVRALAGVFAFGTLVVALLVGLYGYAWFFGMAGYAALWICIIHVADAKLYPSRYGRTMRLIGLANLPLALAFGLAFMSYCGWHALSIMAFQAICAVSEMMFLYITLKHIPAN